MHPNHFYTHKHGCKRQQLAQWFRYHNSQKLPYLLATTFQLITQFLQKINYLLYFIPQFRGKSEASTVCNRPPGTQNNDQYFLLSETT